HMTRAGVVRNVEVRGAGDTLIATLREGVTEVLLNRATHEGRGEHRIHVHHDTGSGVTPVRRADGNGIGRWGRRQDCESLELSDRDRVEGAARLIDRAPLARGRHQQGADDNTRHAASNQRMSVEHEYLLTMKELGVA